MNIHTIFFVDVTMTIIGTHFMAFVLYGRFKKKPLVGNYRPGDEGYEVFIKFVENNKYLLFGVVFTLFFLGSAALDGYRILHETSSYASLVVIPIVALIVFFIVLGVIKTLFRRTT